MGWAERKNLNSAWNRKRATVSNAINQVSTPARNQDEPMVIEITAKSVFALMGNFLCRMLNLKQSRSHGLAPTS